MAAALPADNEALYRVLSVPQHAGLKVRLQAAVHAAHLSADADLDAIADALIGTLLLRVLTSTAQTGHPPIQFDGLLDALLNGSACA